MIGRIGEGAEAIIYRDGVVITKDRVPKTYRIPFIDDKLRIFRTKREIKILEKLAKLGVNVPIVSRQSEKTKITMSFIEGTKLRDYLTKDNFKPLSKEIGKLLSIMHNNDIIHGDLTTSNMIYNEEKGLFVIDFGLSSVSKKIEDKAVDLHLLKHALESYHYEFCDEAFAILIKEYVRGSDPEILTRLEIVEKRGRNKH